MVGKVALFILFAMVLAVFSHKNRTPDEVASFMKYLRKSVHGKPKKPATPELHRLQNEDERSGKFEGDMVLTPSQRLVLIEDFVGKTRNAILDARKLWPNGIIYYNISTNYFGMQNWMNPFVTTCLTVVETNYDNQIKAIEGAISSMNGLSCVKWMKISREMNNFVNIVGERTGCHSNVGMIGGVQIMNLTPNVPGKGCFVKGVIQHELLHSAGFYHTHSEPDRDDYINVVFNNIDTEYVNAFRKYDATQVTTLGISYDYGSVLHYSEYAFSIDGNRTIVPLKSFSGKIGQRVKPSIGDIIKLRKLYNCDE